jgi:hypothetical protein
MARKKEHLSGQVQGVAGNSKRKAAEPMPSGMPAWLTEVEQWEQAPYDGIKGFPPKWVPEPRRDEFVRSRVVLCSLICDGKASYLDIKTRFDSLVHDKYEAINLMLLKNSMPDAVPYAVPLFDLALLYRAISLGEIEGLRRLAGENAVAGFRVRTAHTKRKAASDKPEVQRIGRNYWAANPKATTKDVLSCKELTDYMTGTNPYADRTLGNWLREIDPRPRSAKRGPRSQAR